MQSESPNSLELVLIDGERYFKISDSHKLRPFFMSVVSDANHWMFISSNGALTAGRKNAEQALFPYYTDDKITELSDTTGCKSIFRIDSDTGTKIWEPFSIRQEDRYRISRNLYKNIYGNKIRFEEINHDLQLRFSYEWCSSLKFGFVRKAFLENQSKSTLKIELLDGLQNILPSSVPSDLQNNASNLVDAYKRSELHNTTGLGIYALSAIIVDRAEPSEALKANVVWSKGLNDVKYLMSSLQLDGFRINGQIKEERDIKGEKGAYFQVANQILDSENTLSWILVADVDLNHTKTYNLIQKLESETDLINAVLSDIEAGTKKLISLNASSDGLQCTADPFRDARHFSNVLFNNMRGGIFDDNYKIEKWDFEQYLKGANKELYVTQQDFLVNLPDVFHLQELQQITEKVSNPDLKRLSLEYLPIKFSRRHGDPSRPWNKFSINTVNELDGSKVLDYQGNWRDIFQNWEAMAHSFPEFIDGMIMRFLNASTFDGYNPYRLTKGGFDWEEIEADDPWSYIGYWGDHQIIYLLKFLEFTEKHKPGNLSKYFNETLFVYANVPYRIKTYNEILKNPKDTIEFDEDLNKQTRQLMIDYGADSGLLKDTNGNLHRVGFIEKILATLLAKLSNFIPEAGIWMNTQRPEWNDANNALVGNGVSMVTLYYLNRFMHFFEKLLIESQVNTYQLSSELHEFWQKLNNIFEDSITFLVNGIDDTERKAIMNQLGSAASDYRNKIYHDSFNGDHEVITQDELIQFIKTIQHYLEHSIKANKRPDGLYHAYNLVSIKENKVSVDYLSEMLEGQVAVLSSAYLDASETLNLLNSLKRSRLFRHDQYSYILYPNKDLPSFLEKNKIPGELIAKSSLLQLLLEKGNTEIVSTDDYGNVHFNSKFRNVDELRAGLSSLSDSFSFLVASDSKILEEIYESVFNHKSFTGRSGTFYGYEGLGSIYWHMVSKLLLAVQEKCQDAIDSKEDKKLVGNLLEHFYEIYEGLGVHKSPELYGAFPTDPYSHTPWHKGAQQPGMTGQVKEDILSRFGELGIRIEQGCIQFKPALLRKSEFHTEATLFEYVDISTQFKTINLKAGSLAFTYCQVPVIYTKGQKSKICIQYNRDETEIIAGDILTKSISKDIFGRNGKVTLIEVTVVEEILK